MRPAITVCGRGIGTGQVSHARHTGQVGGSGGGGVVEGLGAPTAGVECFFWGVRLVWGCFWFLSFFKDVFFGVSVSFGWVLA